MPKLKNFYTWSVPFHSWLAVKLTDMGIKILVDSVKKSTRSAIKLSTLRFFELSFFSKLFENTFLAVELLFSCLISLLSEGIVIKAITINV